MTLGGEAKKKWYFGVARTTQSETPPSLPLAVVVQLPLFAGEIFSAQNPLMEKYLIIKKLKNFSINPSKINTYFATLLMRAPVMRRIMM